MPDAGERLSALLNAKLDGLAAQHAAVVKANVTDLETARIHRTSITTAGELISKSTRVEQTAVRDIDRDTRLLVASVKEGVAKDYLRYRVEQEGDDADVLTVRTEVAALVMVGGISAEIEAVAVKWVQDQFTRFDVKIKNTTGATRDAYLKVKEQTSAPEQTGIDLTTTLKASTKDSNKKDAQDLPTFRPPLLGCRGELPPGEAERLGDSRPPGGDRALVVRRVVPEPVETHPLGTADRVPERHRGVEVAPG